MDCWQAVLRARAVVSQETAIRASEKGGLGKKRRGRKRHVRRENLGSTEGSILPTGSLFLLLARPAERDAEAVTNTLSPCGFWTGRRKQIRR